MTWEQINADFSRRVVCDTGEMEWRSSPVAGVWRKRLELSGPVEGGRVTSLVRFDAGAGFPAHGHPEGEEILVLEDIFSDETGDHPKGTYMLNPEGFIPKRAACCWSSCGNFPAPRAGKCGSTL